jgi:hypothetical protein
MEMSSKWGPVIRLAAVVLSLAVINGAADQSVNREEGEFRIRLMEEEIGREKFVVAISGDSASSSSVLDFRNPSDTRQNVRMETTLQMNARFTPVSYQLKSDVGGKKGAITGVFSPNQAIFEYSGAGSPRKSGLLVGNDYTVLDSNIFHHFIFLARLYRIDGKEKVQKFEVVIPQETDSGVLKITELGRTMIQTAGKKKTETRHLQLDSGVLQIHMWIDNRHTVHRIAVPSRGIEVTRE